MRELAELPRLYAECESLLGRFPFALQPKVNQGKIALPAFSEAALDARSGIMSLLASWSGLVADERGTRKPARREARHLAAFLGRHWAWLAGHPAAPDFAEEVTETAAIARRASTPGGLHVDLGGCVADNCDAALFATSGAPGAPVAMVRCEAGHAWAAHEWLHVARRVSDRKEIRSGT
jgi:hypothetical protein